MGGGGSGTVKGAGRKGGGGGGGRRRGENGEGHHSSAELSRTGDRTGDACGMHMRMRNERRKRDEESRPELTSTSRRCSIIMHVDKLKGKFYSTASSLSIFIDALEILKYV